MDYFQTRDETILMGNIQVDDTTNKMLIYSDFAHHWGDIEKLFLSREPMVVNYDPEQADTLFMRGDTIILTTHIIEWEEQPTPPATPTPEAEVEEKEQEKVDTPPSKPQQDEGHSHEGHSHDEKSQHPSHDDARAESSEHDQPTKESRSKSRRNRDKGKSSKENEKVSTPVSDTTAVEIVADSLAVDSLPPLTAKELKAKQKAEQKKIDAELKRIKAEEKRLRAEQISRDRIRMRAEKIDAQKARAARAAAKRKAKVNARLIKRGKITAEEIALADSLDSLRVVDSLRLIDSLHLADSLALLLPEVDSSLMETIEDVKRDSLYRLIVAYRNTKTLQGDQQSASDSLTMDSRDSTMHLYIDPYIWNGLNQISSEVMDIYTINGELHKAVFTGKPIMASQIDTTYYNQVTGKTITSHFVDNELVRNDVDNNVQTIYFARDEDTGEVTTMVYVESGSASFYIKNQELEGVTYRIQPNYTFYPVALIPTTQPMRLEGFEWRGELRPTRQSFDGRERRPTLRPEKEALPRPEFPIENSIRIDRENYVKDRYWIDRDDVVASHAEEWLESLGYKSGQPRSEESDER